METRKALMSTDPGRFNERQLWEMEGTKDGRLSTNNKNLITQLVRVRPASIELLKKELSELGLIIEDKPTIKRVANRYSELYSRKNGKLAVYYKDKKYKLWEIVEVIKNENRCSV